jgi:peroxiredoxin Q/BCP
MTSISIGGSVPDFTTSSTGDKSIKLSEYQGKKLVLYFYPKDNTSGCIKEGQDFRDHYSQFVSLNTEVFGISRDSLKSHENFKVKQEFQFDLLSDPNEELCLLFDVIKIKNMFGKKGKGIERSTFLIDQQGILVQEWRKVKVKGHVEEVLQAVKVLAESE